MWTLKYKLSALSCFTVCFCWFCTFKFQLSDVPRSANASSTIPQGWTIIKIYIYIYIYIHIFIYIYIYIYKEKGICWNPNLTKCTRIGKSLLYWMTYILELVYLFHRFYLKRAEYTTLFLSRRASLCNQVCLITVCIMNLECSQTWPKLSGNLTDRFISL